MEKEVYHLKDVINKPVRPFAAIVGGSKLSTKVKLLNGLVDRADMIYISGAVRFTFYKALGYPVGKQTIISIAVILCFPLFIFPLLSINRYQFSGV